MVAAFLDGVVARGDHVMLQRGLHADPPRNSG
jgi:hypothetical protein